MAYQMASIPMTLSDLRGHFSVLNLSKSYCSKNIERICSHTNRKADDWPVISFSTVESKLKDFSRSSSSCAAVYKVSVDTGLVRRAVPLR